MDKPNPSSAVSEKDASKLIGYFAALVHVIKGFVGVGLFAMGFAIKNSGIFIGPPLLVFLGAVVVHCQHQLAECAEMVREYGDKDKPLDYGTAVELCFKNGPSRVVCCAKAARIWINVCICLTQFGICCVYLVFIAKNMQQVLSANGVDIDLRILLLVVWLPICIVCLITNLKALVPVSLAANFFLVGSFIATLSAAFMGEMKDLSELKPYATAEQYAIFFGTAIFAFETIALVLPMQNAMINPKSLISVFGVLNVGITFVIAIYLLSGITGYVRWGDEVGGSLTLNLGETVFAQCVKAAVSLGIMFTYPLHFYVPIEVFLPGFLVRAKLVERARLGELIFRVLMTICTVLVAELVPNVGLFISLIGALCSTALGLIFPPLTECFLLDRSTYSRFVKVLIICKNVLIVIVGFVSFTAGTTICVIEIVEYFQKSLEKGFFE